MTKFLALVALAFALSGCVTTSVGDFCKIAEPIRTRREAVDLLPEAELDRQLAHNRYGAKHCGWTP